MMKIVSILQQIRFDQCINKIKFLYSESDLVIDKFNRFFRPFSPSPFLRLSLLSQRLKHPLTHTMVMLDMVMVTVMVMVMVFMADTDMVDTDMVDTAVDTDTDTTLARDPLMLMPKPAQLCSMVPMDTHTITESTHTLMPHSD